MTVLKIVSLVPSLTQTVCDLGLQQSLVGITSFCVKPKGLHKTATIVGGTKDPRIGQIKELTPSHIITNTEENRPDDILACQSIAPVLETFPKGPEDVPRLLQSMGEFLSRQHLAKNLAEHVSRQLEEIKGLQGSEKQRFLYLIWRDPYMAASKDTYISRMLGLLGWKNVLDTVERYPVVDPHTINDLKSTRILLSSEPFPFRNRHREELISQYGISGKILRCDGQKLSWYGTETIEALDELIKFIQGKEQKTIF